MVPSASIESKIKPTAAAEEEEKRNKRLMDLCRDGSMDLAFNYSIKHTTDICNSINSPIDDLGNVPLHLTVSQNDHVPHN
jgi:hypothetical protein